MRARSSTCRVVALVGAILIVPGIVRAALDAQLTSSSASGVVGQSVQLMLTVTSTGGAGDTNVTAQAWTADAALVSDPTPGTVASLADGTAVTFVWTATLTGTGTITFTASATADGPTSSLQPTAVVTVPPAALAARLAASTAAGQYPRLWLTVTNTGGAAATNVSAKAWTADAASLSAPTPATVASLAPGAAVTFAWTATPTAAGTVTFTASATADGPIASTKPAVAVTVPAAALDARVAWSRTAATNLQGTLVSLTVTNTGGLPVTNVIPQIAVTGPGIATVPTPMSAATLIPGQAQTFAWTVTGTAAGTVMYTVNATGDGPVVSPLRTGTVAISPMSLISRILASTATVWAGQAVVITLSVTNAGGTPATNVTARGWANLPVTGTPGNGTASSATSAASLAAGGKMTFSWTVTPTLAGIVTFTATVTADAGAVAPAASLTVTVYAGSSSMAVQLTCGKRTTVDAPVQFLMSLTNTGTMTIVNLTAALWSDSLASIGASTPSSTVTVAPKGQATWVWTVTASDARAMNFYAVATGFTASATGQVAIASAQVGVTLAGIPAPGAKAAFVYPSPARDAANIAYTMAEGGTVKIRVYNEIGDLVATVEETRTAGVWSSPLTTSGLAPGVYFLLVEKKYDSGTSEKAGMKKFVVVH